jgi:hypothetical protein
VRWQYRTLLFEFQKDGLLGDKYIDDEEVEELLNEQGALGWELVNVAMIQEGLLAFCKRPIPHGIHSVADTYVQDSHGEKLEESISTETIQQQERAHIRQLEKQRRETMSSLEQNVVGDIKIS